MNRRAFLAAIAGAAVAKPAALSLPDAVEVYHQSFRTSADMAALEGLGLRLMESMNASIDQLCAEVYGEHLRAMSQASSSPQLNYEREYFESDTAWFLTQERADAAVQRARTRRRGAADGVAPGKTGE